MRVRVRYFAMLREQAGRDAETRDTDAATPAELYAELAEAHGFTLPAAHVGAAVNDTFVGMDARLREGDAVTYLPPVAGG